MDKVVSVNSKDDVEREGTPATTTVKYQGAIYRIKELSAYDSLTLRGTGDDFMFRMIAKSLIDESGERIYSDSDEDLGRLQKRVKTRLVMALWRAVNKLNGDVEEIEKNSDAGQSAGSSST